VHPSKKIATIKTPIKILNFIFPPQHPPTIFGRSFTLEGTLPELELGALAVLIFPVLMLVFSVLN